MTIIKCLAEKIEEELDDASAYIDLAMKWKQEVPEASNLFYQLSTEEMGHMERLHQEVVRLIEKYRTEHGEPPEKMMVLYEYLHEKHVGKATEIKIKQAMYKAE